MGLKEKHCVQGNLAEATQVAHSSVCDPGLEKAKGSTGMTSPSSLALLSAPCCHFYPRISFELEPKAHLLGQTPVKLEECFLVAKSKTLPNLI